jgi:ABC-2 type transport system permease protein
MTSALAVAIKEVRQISRDRQSLLVLLFLPAFFLFLYGYALNFDIRHVALAVQDRDGSSESRRLVASFIKSGYFDLEERLMTEAQITGLMNEGRARGVLVIPEGFSRALREGRTADVQLLLDGDNANTASTVLGYANAVLADPSALGGGDIHVAVAGVDTRVWYNPELRSTLFLVPGLIAYIAMITSVAVTSMSIVREKENGTMEQIRMSPISMPAFLAGKTLPYLALSQLSAMMVIGASMLLFGLPVRGSWVTLQLVVAVFLVGALATGLFVSTVADTQQTAFQISTLIAFLPTFILSGFIFPIANMPIALQYVTTLVPARYFLVALRGVVLKGLPLEAVAMPVAALALYACAALTLAAVRLARSRG